MDDDLVACANCTFLNKRTSQDCEMCALPLAGASTPQSARRKNRDASHLLNFAQVRREEHDERRRRTEMTKRDRATRDKRTQSEKLRLLHENVHFFTKCGVGAPDDASAAEWSQVTCVRLVTSDMEGLRCPICLSDPTAPQMYRCGHVLCLACAMRLHSNCDADSRVAKCPFCAENVELSEMRSCRIFLADKASAESSSAVSFVKLPLKSFAVKSFAEAVVPVPTSACCTEVINFDPLFEAELAELEAAEKGELAVAQAAAAKAAAKASEEAATKPTPAAAAHTWGPPAREARKWTAADALRDGAPTAGAEPRVEAAPPLPPEALEELRFYRLAQEVVQQRRQSWHAERAEAKPPSRGGTASRNRGQQRGERASAHSPELAPSSESADESGRGAFQLADGQHVYADPFSLRVLMQQFGSFAACPEQMAAPIAQLQTFRQSDATRKRFKALAHLPTATTFALAELDLSAIVSAEVISHFSEDIGRRKKDRQRRKAEEERAARADAARCERERRKHGKSALAIELDMLRLTPAERERRREQLLADAPDVQVSGEWADQWQQRETERQQLEAPSFARMVEEGFGASGPVVQATSPSWGGRSPPSPAWPSGAATLPPCARLLPAASPSVAVPPSRGTSLLRSTEPTPVESADTEQLASSPPSLGVGWASAPLETAIGSGKKKKANKGRTLISNAGGRALT